MDTRADHVKVQLHLRRCLLSLYALRRRVVTLVGADQYPTSWSRYFFSPSRSSLYVWSRGATCSTRAPASFRTPYGFKVIIQPRPTCRRSGFQALCEPRPTPSSDVESHAAPCTHMPYRHKMQPALRAATCGKCLPGTLTSTARSTCCWPGYCFTRSTKVSIARPKIWRMSYPLERFIHWAPRCGASRLTLSYSAGPLALLRVNNLLERGALPFT